LIFEKRSGAYILSMCEQRIAENQGVTSEIVEMSHVVMGRIGASYGVQGWVKLHPVTDAVDDLFDYDLWLIGDSDTWRPAQVESARVHGKHLVVKFEGVDTPEAASLLTHMQIAVEREAFPELEEGEFYWADLEGLSVITEAGQVLGTIDRLFETGANDVMVVKGDRERLIPYVRPDVVKHIDLAAGQMTVDWDPEF